MHAQDVIVSASHTISPWGTCVPALSLSPLPSETHSLITEQQREEVRRKWEKRAKARNREEEALSAIGGKMGAPEQL